MFPVLARPLRGSAGGLFLIALPVLPLVPTVTGKGELSRLDTPREQGETCHQVDPEMVKLHGRNPLFRGVSELFHSQIAHFRTSPTHGDLVRRYPKKLNQ
jgi:hypothetical protein